MSPKFYLKNSGDIFRVINAFLRSFFLLTFTLDQYRGEHVAEIDILGDGMEILEAVHLDLKV